MDEKRAQHEAALSYLDTGTVALADVLAMIDDLPPDTEFERLGVVITPPVLFQPAHRRPSRRVGRKVGALFGVAALAVGATLVGAGVFSSSPPTASAASPFDDPTFQTVLAGGGWTCKPAVHHFLKCTGPADSFARVDAFDTETQTRYVGSGVVRGHAAKIVLVISHDEATEAATLAEANALPSMYPNLRTGYGWMLWGSDPTEVANDTRALVPVLIQPKATPPGLAKAKPGKRRGSPAATRSGQR